MKVNNIGEIAAAGADMFVAGSAIFDQPDYKKVIDEMRSELAKVSHGISLKIFAASLLISTVRWLIVLPVLLLR
ncbi:ribulose-phosphate 3-epimerase [Escherichia coli]|uniref:Ribulose-phosphate 3-epimerase n=1 Tax=Escherichia coli TaxID=562 RepID=A0A376NW38_ECOLX|nr:ribulose-phosphate 3-epimerase [Escherichia coli]